MLLGKAHARGTCPAFTESCTFVQERMECNADDFAKFSGGTVMYVDSSFPADESSLFWRDHIRDLEMP